MATGSILLYVKFYMLLLQVHNLLTVLVVGLDLKQLGCVSLCLFLFVVLDVVNGEVLVGSGELLDVGSCLVLLSLDKPS